VFIDLLERMTVLIGANGSVLRQEIDGAIQMKSFLQGTPEIFIGLNENMSIGKSAAGVDYGVTLDDCNFHDCAQLDHFEQDRTVTLRPPDGEFTLMKYVVSLHRHPRPHRGRSTYASASTSIHRPCDANSR
jgi:AP-4 complex subunit mu-1